MERIQNKPVLLKKLKCNCGVIAFTNQEKVICPRCSTEMAEVKQ